MPDTYVRWVEGDRAALERIIKDPQSLEQATLADEVERLRTDRASIRARARSLHIDYGDDVPVIVSDFLDDCAAEGPA